MANDDFDLLRSLRHPAPNEAAKSRALRAAMDAFNAGTALSTQGTPAGRRLTDRMRTLWGEIMQKKLIATPAFGALIALPIAGYLAYDIMRAGPLLPVPGAEDGKAGPQATGLDTDKRLETPAVPADPAKPAKPDATTALDAVETEEADRDVSGVVASPPPATLTEAPSAAPATQDAAGGRAVTRDAPLAKLRAPAQESYAVAPSPEPSAEAASPADILPPAVENRDRLDEFKTNPVRSALEDPVSTFSIDTDTASYSFVRRSLKEGFLPQADTVRVEELVNYFPYDWKGPDSAATPFNATVTVMPTPWNEHTKLMHVAIKGYDVAPAAQPKSNLVFLIDVSGSMDQPDKLPLLKSAFRLLVDKLGPDDTVSIVTYAGDAGTVLEPTSGAERQKILQAIDTLRPGGSTAGEAGIREAYRLAQKAFIEGGVNRVMLATDGDFNVGQTDDDDLKRLIEEKRETGVFLSVFGFGRGNLNDRMMQTIAQNGNGTAAYIDTLAEAEKVLVQEASATLFPIAKDVKIQVEFNPAAIAEYRLIGYETRALNREDFNNDRVDAGEIGSGHAVTAIYEVTPKGSPAKVIDDLRYGEATVQNPGGIAGADEYAFVKIRYKLPDEDVSKLIATPVTAANEVASFDAAGTDQRFSVAVAAFGQKLRGADQTAGFGWEKIAEIATAARGTDPFGYRAEFLSLLRLASALEAGRR